MNTDPIKSDLLNSAPPPYNIDRGTIYEIDGRSYIRATTQPAIGTLLISSSGETYLHRAEDGSTRLPTADDIDALLADGRLVFVRDLSGSRASLTFAAAEFDLADLELIDPEVRKRFAQVVLLDSHGIKNGTKAIQAGLDRYWTKEYRDQFGDHDKPSTIKRWRSERGEPGNRSHRQMVRMTGRVPRDLETSSAIDNVKFKHALICVSANSSMRTGYTKARAELDCVNRGEHPSFPAPEVAHKHFSYATFVRVCHELRNSETLREKDGPEMVRAVMEGGGKPETAGRILEKVQIDHTPLDAFVVVDPGVGTLSMRPWLTIAIDVKSRVILSTLITLLPPSYATVAESLRRMALPKRPPEKYAKRHPILRRICGRPTLLTTDNAFEFRCLSMQDLAAASGMTIRFAPIKKPRYRAIGERAMAVLPAYMLEAYRGKTQSIKHQRLSKADPESKAEITLAGLEALANLATTYYHLAPHEGLNDASPAKVFQKGALRHGIDVMYDIRSFLLESMEVEFNVRITNTGARMFGLRYYCSRNVLNLLDDNLRYEPRRDTKAYPAIRAKVKYDPANIGSIWVLSRHTRKYLELKCELDHYSDGMPLALHHEIMQRAKCANADEIDQVELNEIRAEMAALIRTMAPKAAKAEREALAKLAESPRIRAVTGSIVDLDFEFRSEVTPADFIGHNMAAETALDVDLRRVSDSRRRRSTSAHDRRSNGAPRTQHSNASRPMPRRSRTGHGG